MLLRKLIRLFAPKPAESSNGSHRRPVLASVVALFLVGSLLSCGTSSVKPQLSPIVFTDANGNAVAAVTSIKAGTGVYMMVGLKSDTALLGANWLVTCSSALPPGTPLPPGQVEDESCGFFTPVHTASGPVPSYATSGAGIVTLYEAPNSSKVGSVTLYASATTDPAVVSTITLAVMP